MAAITCTTYLHTGSGASTIVLRTRLDSFGDPKEQIYLPQSYRQKCLVMAHSKFGHQGRNKMVALICPYFYWPSLTTDCMKHIRECETCQRMDKTSQKPCPMQSREITSVPFERIAVDLVGPFPAALGGFRFLLTTIDLATRWPEAVPVRTTTVKVITSQLVNIFSITTDNGPQFKGNFFRKWLKGKGIQHIVSSPYHPQGNGVVERLHRTLNTMVAKMCEAKGNWASVVPMALYFIRSTPCSATGMSPFVARQGWEPATPIQLLYKVWAEQDLGGVDLEEWVLQNCDKIEVARDKAMSTKLEVASKRKQMWDKKAKLPMFVVGYKVLTRKPGLNIKIEESREGPFVITKVNSPLSYAVDTGNRKIPSVHVQLIKKFNESAQPKVLHITSVLEPDQKNDTITDRLAETKIAGDELNASQLRDIERIEKDFEDILTTEPGLTSKVEFALDTGDSTCGELVNLEGLELSVGSVLNPTLGVHRGSSLSL